MDEKILKALGEPRRFLLLQLLSERSYCVGALAHRSSLTESAVSQHLRILREAGLIHGSKKGYYTHYRLNREALDQVIGELVQLRDTRSIPCSRPFYGCPEAEFLKCSAYVPPEEREEDPC